MIVDANVATYWLVASPFQSSAGRIVDRPDLLAPAIIRVETASALLKYLRAGLITTEQVRDSFDLLEEAISEFVDDAGLVRKAAEIAAANKHSVYDCLYLALALDRREPLATADRRLAALAQSLGIAVELIQPDQPGEAS